ncbi:MAG: hypothetical protein EBZ49_18055, partial [Proteobacteria bacterium]|nr:hypothetical protein [Pseudomonadota bacterium]
MLGTLQITGGTPGAGKVLTSDANGNATWQDASSSSGADTTLRNLFLPPAPTGLSATAGNAQATLAWTAPSVLSQIPITNYSYQVSSNGGSSWGTAVLTNSTAASATVTGLTNGTAYVFKVAGVNGVGTGSYSSASSSVTPALDPYISNVVLLLHMDGANGATTFTDSSTTPKSISRVGDAQISTAQSKFGGASLKLDGSSGYLTIPADTSLDMGANDFTIEFWAYGQDQSRAYPTYLAGQGGWYGGAWGIRFDNTGYSQRFGFFFNPGDPFFSSSSTYSFNQWRHIALSRQSGT